MESVKNNTKDSIAILMATYNGARFISEQIESILSQSNQLWHLYIHDELHESAGED